METLNITIIAGGISLLTSIITARITLALTRKNETHKHILEERSKLYFEIFPTIDILINERYKLVDNDYIEKFLSYKAKMKLIASEKTFEKYKCVFSIVISTYNMMDIYKGLKNGESEENFCHEQLSLFDREDLKLSSVDFVLKHLPDQKTLVEVTDGLYREMRVDLGSNIR